MAKGTQGVAVCYKAFMTIPRRVWISPGFSDNHQVLVAIINGVAAQLKRQCKWKFLPDIEEFVQKSSAAKGGDRAKDVIGIVTAAEKKARSVCQQSNTPSAAQVFCQLSQTFVHVSHCFNLRRLSRR